MAGTKVRITRKILTEDVEKRYSIQATCIDAGTLTDTGIFLMTIVDTTDPKDDTLSRIITVADVNDFVNNRDTAVSNADAFWRSSTLTLNFADIETANEANNTLTSRINTLVNSIDEFASDFVTDASGIVVTYPTADASLKASLEAAYQASLQPVTDAQEARDTQVQSCTILETELAPLQDRLTEAQADLAKLQAMQASGVVINGALPSIQSTLNVNQSTVRSANETSDATDTQKDSIEATLVLNDAQLTAFSAQNSSLNTLITVDLATCVQSFQTRVNTLTAERNAKQTELNTCQQSVAALQAAVDAAQEARDAALAALVDVCPDFTP